MITPSFQLNLKIPSITLLNFHIFCITIKYSLFFERYLLIIALSKIRERVLFMKLLKEKICNEGKFLDGNILKVDGFLNHQMDIRLINEMGKEFAKRFQACPVDRILTVEASGIGIAAIASQYFGYVPVVFAKKNRSGNLSPNVYSAEVFSFTKKKTNHIMVDKEYIKKGDNVLIIDDFLATGSAALGLCSIVQQAQANVSGAGIVIEKSFQEGRQLLEEKGIKVESLARVSRIEKGHIELL